MQERIEAAEKLTFTSAADDQLTLKAQEEVHSDVQRLQANIVTARQDRDALMFAIADSARFIQSLEAKIAALNDSAAVATHLGDIRFTVCPACYGPLEDDADELRTDRVILAGQ